MAVPFNAIKESLNYITEFFGTILDYLNPFSENFILLKVWNFLTDIVSYLNPFSENFLGKKIVELFGDLLKFLFVPENTPFNDLKLKFDEKFVFVGQIKVLINNLLGFNNYGDKVPEFNITWHGVTVSIIDFSLFLNYRIWLHGIILAIAWFSFLFKTFKKLPTIIGGFSQ